MPYSPKHYRPAGHKTRKAWEKPATAAARTLNGATRKRMKQAIIIRDEYTCQQCGKLVDLHESHLDHVVPITQGGDDSPENLQTLCIGCSKAKTQRESRGGR